MQNIINKQKSYLQYFKHNFCRRGSTNGFTIIETMISVSLFLVIIMSGMGALLNANLLHNKSRDMRSIMDNLSFIMEDMSRNLRTGYEYKCFDLAGTIVMGIPESCISGWAIAFKPQSYVMDNKQWVYYVDSGKIFRSTDNGNSGSFIQLTPDEVVISQSYAFSVLGAEPPPGDSQQPFVTIKLVGTITYKNNVVTPFSLQTSVSQRKWDI